MNSLEDEYAALQEWAFPSPPQLPETTVDEATAREWATANPNSDADIQIAKPCQQCRMVFQTFVYGGLVSPRFCSRACIEEAFPAPAVQHFTRARRKKRAASTAEPPEAVDAVIQSITRRMTYHARKSLCIQ